MIKSQNRAKGAILILLMLGASPLSVTYSFAEMAENQESKGEDKSSSDKESKKDRLRAILTEKIVNGKLKVRHYALPNDVSERDLQRMLSLEGHTTGWAYVNAKAYNSGIILFDGKASKLGDDIWEISTIGILTLGEQQFDLELDGKINGSHVVMGGNASEEDLNYRVIFSGKIVEMDEQNMFIISILNSGLKNFENGQNIKIQQFGELAINSKNSIGSIQEFRNSILVR